MAQVGRKRYIPFRIADIDGNPVTGRQLSDFTTVFLRDGEPCADTLTIEEIGGGLYLLTYTPSAVGQDYLDLYDSENDLRVGDDEFVAAAAEVSPLVGLTQDTGGTGALKPIGIANLQNFTLYIFRSQVWQTGDHNPLSAEASTPLDGGGNWLTSPLTVLKDVYHVVLMNGSGEVHVIRPFLDLTQ